MQEFRGRTHLHRHPAAQDTDQARTRPHPPRSAPRHRNRQQSTDRADHSHSKHPSAAVNKHAGEPPCSPLAPHLLRGLPTCAAPPPLSGAPPSLAALLVGRRHPWRQPCTRRVPRRERGGAPPTPASTGPCCSQLTPPLPRTCPSSPCWGSPVRCGPSRRRGGRRCRCCCRLGCRGAGGSRSRGRPPRASS